MTALKRGADGYLLKDMEPEDLLKSLQQAAAGEMVLSEALTPVLAASLRANRATSDRDVTQLTPRERDILKLIAQGLPNKMIARRLDITERQCGCIRNVSSDYSSGSNLQRGSSPGIAIKGSVSVSVISLEETRCPFSSSTTTDNRQRLLAPSLLSQAGIITVQPSTLSAFAPAVRLSACASPCQVR